VSFLDPVFFCFLSFFFLGAAMLRGKLRIWFYTLMSYIFYSAAYPPYVVLLALISVINFYTGHALDKARGSSTRRLVVVLGVAGSLLLLGYFKYAGWLVQSIVNVLFILPIDVKIPIPRPALPVGISFFTFQALSYTIDIYRKQIEPNRSLLEFTCFVAFFPQLVAGPIVRSREFLPQIPNHQPLMRADTVRGLELVLIGYFKKCVIADNLAPLVDRIFWQANGVCGLVMWFGVLCFAFQIFCDFGGYSDIARGLGRILGFKIPVNFRWPYLSESIQEFWRRWHITLSFWIRDYIYFPLGGSRVAFSRYLFNMMITWLLCGLWHGANISFVLWGLYHGFLLTAGRLIARTRMGQIWDLAPRLIRISWTFFLVLIGWALFRSPDLLTARTVLTKMFLPTDGFFCNWRLIVVPLTLLTLAGFVHMLSSHLAWDVDNKSLMSGVPWAARVLLIGSAITLIVVLAGQQESFIYFAF
jgi:alginate O-acetyltransferase complex protein AlgI